jgi:hypothetical protein
MAKRGIKLGIKGGYVICPECGKPRYFPNSYIKMGKKFCSIKCAKKYQHKKKGGIYLHCVMCCKKYYVNQNKADNSVRSGHYCSQKCAGKGKHLLGVNTKESNYRWNGGASMYPDHYIMKQNRLIRMKQAKGLCEVCGNPAKIVHHKDLSVDNHALDNLVVLCKPCHVGLHNNGHHNTFRTSKAIRLYGMSFKDMASKYGGCPETYRQKHYSGTLVEFLANPQSVPPQPQPHTSKFIRLYGLPLWAIAKKLGRTDAYCWIKHKTGELAGLLANTNQMATNS